MAEDGCITDFRAKNLECNNLLIKDGTINLLSTRIDNKLGVGTDIIPDADITYSLGTASRRFKELHLSPGTLHLGDQTLKSSNDGIELDKIVAEEISLTKNNIKQKFIPHNSLGINHTFTMPQSLPSATRFLKCDTSGNFTFDNIDYDNGPGTLTSIFTSDILVKEYAIGVNFNEDFDTKISTGFNDRVDISLNKNLMLGETEENTLFVNSTTFFDSPVYFNQNNPVITLSGDVSGTATMNNLKDVTINTTIQNNSVALGTDTTGNYIATIVGTSNEISVSNSGSENANVILSLPTTTSISSGKTLDVSSGTFTTSTSQQQTIVSSTNVINAGGVMTTGNQTISGLKTFSNTIIGDINGNAESVTNGVYTTSSATALNDITSAGSGSIITDSERTKLNGIEALADITDTTNVTSAGAVMKNTIDAKGDILVGTANNTITKLPVGTNNFVLSADSSTTTGLKWKAVSGSGGGSSTFEELTDTESFSGNAGKILKLNTSENLLEFVDESSGGGGSTTFLNLTDVTPSSYSGQSGKSVIVNSSENGIEFGLGNVDNTSDTNKPISTAQQTALDLKSPIANPTFTGTVGVGITNPNSSLHIQANTSNKFDAFRISNKTSNDLDFTIQKVNRLNGFDYNSCVIGHGLEIDSTYSNTAGNDGKFHLNTDGTSVAGSAIVSQNGKLSFFTYNTSSSSDIQILGSEMSNMSLYNNGNLGINNSYAISKLQLREDGSSNNVDASDSATFNNYHFIMNKEGGTDTGSEIGLCMFISGSGFVPTATTTPGAAITHERTGGWSKGKMHFKTKHSTSSTASCVTAMTISDNGSVGIGLTSPRKELHLKNAGDNTELVIESGGDDQSIITLCEDSSGNFGFDIQYDGGSTVGSISNMFYIRAINNGTKTISLTSKRTNGFIGILDDNPSTALDVNGTITCTGFNNTSDDRIKYNEVNINTSTALNVINQLTPQKYEKIIERPQNLSGTWIPTDIEWETEKNETITQINEDGSTTILPKWNYQNETGLVAQDVKNINELSYCVIGDEVDTNGNQTPLKLNYTDIFSYHIAATKELTTQLNTANQKIVTLENEIAAIKQHLGI